MGKETENLKNKKTKRVEMIFDVENWLYDKSDLGTKVLKCLN